MRWRCVCFCFCLFLGQGQGRAKGGIGLKTLKEPPNGLSSYYPRPGGLMGFLSYIVQDVHRCVCAMMMSIPGSPFIIPRPHLLSFFFSFLFLKVSLNPLSPSLFSLSSLSSH
ncbi:MAG: hypothetical protein J3R72DRAFT_455153 [Linnemannia gamsii]|nr:MAG: hypothetical protein J3R72DRAFT_455153 [Linnemannia gamsii]